VSNDRNDVNWQELYDRLAKRYNTLEESLRECRTRLERVEADSRLQARRELLDRFFLISDDIEKLHAAARGDCGRERLAEAVELLSRGTEKLLKTEEVTTVEAEPGTEFDPAVHEAFAVVESDTIAKDRIVEKIRSGYLHKDRLLRAARVVVSRGPRETSQDTHAPGTDAESDEE
jgi:molecular chaperone GrpE